MPEAWQTRHQTVSPALLRAFEEKILQRAEERLEQETRIFLRRLAVMRVAPDLDAMRFLAPSGTDMEAMRNELIDRFMLELRANRYVMHSVLRATVLRQLDDGQRRKAHDVAGHYFARPFMAKQVAGRPDHISRSFLEARYHLTHSGNTQSLQQIAQGMEQHLRQKIGFVTPLPAHPQERDEQIGLLSALLEIPGAYGLEYYLARLLLKRCQPGDEQSALVHLQRATGPRSPVEAWALRTRLEHQLKVDFLSTLERGIQSIPADAGLVSLYQLGADLLSQDGRRPEAIELIHKGIGVIPADKNLFSLYQLGAELLSQDGRRPEAIELINQGIGVIPADKNLFSLYQLGAELLSQDGRHPEAIELINQGIGVIPADKSLFSLYQSGARLFKREGKQEAALDLLRQGFSRLGMNRGYPLVEDAIFLAAQERNMPWLQSILDRNDWGEIDKRQRLLGELLLLEKDNLWQAVAEQGQISRHLYVALFCHAVLALIGIGRAGEACQLFEEGTKGGSELPSAWLAALLVCLTGKSCGVDTRGWALGGRLVESFTKDELPAILAHWDLDVARRGERNVAHYFPFLPPILLQTMGDQPPRVPTERRETLNVLVVATEWESRHGGVSTFNRDLCSHLVSLGGCRVVCCVPEPDQDDVLSAGQANVELVKAVLDRHDNPRAVHQAPVVPDGFRPDLIIGHDRVTGSEALAIKQHLFPQARLVLFIHTHPGKIQNYKSRDAKVTASRSGEDRDDWQRELAVHADCVVAVGPRLFRHAESLLVDHPDKSVSQFIPGLIPHRPSSRTLSGLNCLLVGRCEDPELKGLDIAARAMGLCDSGQDITLMVRGAEAGQGDSLRRDMLKWAQRPGVDITVREYSPSLEKLSLDLQRASVLLMPSREEGFGLVGWEALSLGVPILVSDKSGLAEVMKQYAPADSKQFIVSVVDDIETDGVAWKNVLQGIAQRPADSVQRDMGRLCQTLSGQLTWNVAIQQFLQVVADGICGAHRHTPA
ncbi:MAG: glycosyltransferase [Magnetococcus sp. DMHC-8]